MHEGYNNPADLGSWTAVGRRLCTDSINPDYLSAFVACRLIPLDKCPGVRPIGIGEDPRRIIAKPSSQYYNQTLWRSLDVSKFVLARTVAVRPPFMQCVKPSTHSTDRQRFTTSVYSAHHLHKSCSTRTKPLFAL